MISVPRWATSAALAFAAAICVNAVVTYSLIGGLRSKSSPRALPAMSYAVGYVTPSIDFSLGYLILKWQAAGGILYHVRTTTIGEMADGTVQSLDPKIPQPPFALAPGDSIRNILSLDAGQQPAHIKFIVAAARYSDDHLTPHVVIACLVHTGNTYREASTDLANFAPLLASLSHLLGFVTRCS